MKNKYVFLDRDGTINIDVNYLHTRDQFEYNKNALEALRLLSQKNFKLIIITNQSGIGRGLFTEDEYNQFNYWFIDKLKEDGINILDNFHCPHYLGSKIKKYDINCDCRKPKLGLFKQAIEKYNINLDETYAIGDKMRDLTICQKSNCLGYLVYRNEELNVIDLVKSGKIKNVQYKTDLLEAVKDIVKQEAKK